MLDLPFYKLYRSNSKIVSFLNRNRNNLEELPPTMRDGLTGISRPGTWSKGLSQQRWEDMLIQKDTNGVLKVFRPILDLRLSMVEADGRTGILRQYQRHRSRMKVLHTSHYGTCGISVSRDRFKNLLTIEDK